jgi:hypothetical protein
MLSNDVMRGCLWALAVGGGVHALGFAAIALPDAPASAFWIGILTLVVAGLAAIPFAAVALLTHAFLAKGGKRVLCWVPSLAIASIAFAICGPAGGPDILWFALYCAILGVLTGTAFWLGAVGWAWSAKPELKEVSNPAFRDKVM